MSIEESVHRENSKGPSARGERRQNRRRGEDRDRQPPPEELSRKLQALLDLGRLIAQDLGLDTLLFQIAEKAAEVIGADRCSIFLHDPQTEELWVTVATGLDGRTIRIPEGSGIAGACFTTGKVINLADAYQDPRFNPEPDSRTGYRTRSLLCIPLIHRDQEIIGVIQLLNKKAGQFTSEDVSILQTFANQAAVFLEMARLQQSRIEALEESRAELRRLNQAKDKALDHLSHELRTPLAVIQGKVRLLQRKLFGPRPQALQEDFFDGLERNLTRLFEIQQETEKILRSHRRLEERHLLEALDRRLERLQQRGEIPPSLAHQWPALRDWLTSRQERTEAPRRAVVLGPLVRDVVQRIRDRASGRDLRFEMEETPDLVWAGDPKTCREALRALLKNAVENTPDGGRIRVRIQGTEEGVEVGVEDSGVGISPEHQKYLFDGLFHTQATDLYTSKKPMAFNAGGKGLDLLRTKLAGERFGFRLAVQSRRCRYLPREDDVCPGRVASCGPGRDLEECAAAGGSRFSLIFENVRQPEG